MAYMLKIWAYTEAEGWRVGYNPLPETLEDARSLANWWIQHSKELRMEVQIIQGCKIVDTIETDDKGQLVIKERRNT